MVRLLPRNVLLSFAKRRLSSKFLADVMSERQPVELTDVDAKGKVLSRILGVSVAEASLALRPFHELLRFADDDMGSVAEFVLSQGVDPREILKRPKILGTAAYQISYKARLVEKTSNRPLLESFPLLALDQKCLLTLRDNLSGDMTIFDGKSRPEYLSSSLDLSITDACDLFERYSFLPSVAAPKIWHVMDVLLSARVDKKAIVRDLWILQHNVDVMKQRVQLARDRGVIVKPWLLRCPDSRFQKSIADTSENSKLREASGGTLEYIAERLECSVDDVKEQFAKFPPLMQLSPRKLKRGLDVLFAAGFTPDRILNGLRVVAYSPSKIEERLELLQRHEKALFVVTPLAWPERRFLRFYGLPESSEKCDTNKS